MSDVPKIIEEFIAHLGFKPQQLDPMKPLVLHFHSTGHFYIEKIGDEVLLYLMQDYPVVIQSMYQKALELVHHHHWYPSNITASLKGEKQLVFSTRLSADGLTKEGIEQGYNLLKEMHQKMV